MLRSMNAGVSGLRSHQTMMDVVGNNIANVNTIGYKSGSAQFSDLLSQMMRGAGTPNTSSGGTNPAQVGLGVRVSGIQNSFTQGALQLTGRSTDVGIQGDGFFIVERDGEQIYTRAGSFNLDVNGDLVNADGQRVMGWTADTSGVINTNAGVGAVNIPVATQIPPVSTSTVELGGNLESTRALATPLYTNITVYDGQGRPLELQLEITRTAANAWSVQPRNAATGNAIGGAVAMTWSTVTNSWTPASLTVAQAALNAIDPAPLAARGFTGPISVDLSQLTQYGSATSATALSQNGGESGSLQSFSIGTDGTISGAFTNGVVRSLGRVALATFNNPSGLEKVGSTAFRSTVNSGVAQIGTAGAGGRGQLAGGTLESSNVDLAQEFTSLIVAQRGFQSNSRVITTADEMLQELVNLKR